MKNNIKYVNLAQLETALAGLLTATTATITTVTEPKMNKKNNPFLGLVKKVSTANVILKFNYANSVNTQLKKEDKDAVFVPKSRAWGVHRGNTCLIDHTPKGAIANVVYVEARFLKGAQSTFIFDGKVIAKSEIAAHLQEANSNSEHQGLSDANEVIMRDIKLSNVIEIKMLGSIYKVI